jgi:type IV pilus assembly protein PilC
MPTFHYKAARPNGTTVEAAIDGSDERAVRGQLERDGLIVLSLRGESKTSRTPGRFRWSGKVSLHEFLVFNQELLAMLKAGLPVLQVWDLLIERAEQPHFQETLRMVREDIRGGSAVSDAMSRHPKIFSDLYVATIRAGEQSGNLPTVLQRYVHYLKLMISLKQKVTKALAYPAFLVIIGAAVVGFLLVYVMPTFVGVYGDSAQSLPPATLALLQLIDVLQAQWLTLGIGLMLLVFGVRSYRATAEGRYTTDRLLLRLPGLGPILLHHNTVQLTQTLATVLAGGIPLVNALEVASGAMSNRFIARGVYQAVGRVREGTTLAAALAERGVLPKLATAMVSVGEETGSLETMLKDVGEFYENSLDLKLTQMTTWIEPALLLIMGVLVGTVVVIMYLPVFQMAGTIQ